MFHHDVLKYISIHLHRTEQMVNEGIITLLLFIRLMNWEYDSDPGQRQHIINLGTESDTHQCREEGKTVITGVSKYCPREVFEGVQAHVLDLFH